ncbi:MAG: type II toxin-antitoxin system VapC family toxin [Synergistaceae bacterium]|nr:type II toxin-antitoxin system VapC family toxin [Synergistaceae bacterium]
MYILDTCAFIWAVQNSPNLSPKVLAILDGDDDVFVSQASFWEIAIKQTTGKLNLDKDIFALEDVCKAEEIQILPLELAYFERIKTLPLIHRDPFDRIIIASAIEEDLTLLTNDGEIVKYQDVKTLW